MTVIQDRPHFGLHQVRTPAGIKPGNVLNMVRGERQVKTTIIVLSEPYQNERGQLVFDLVYKEHLSHDILLGHIYYMDDFGIVPYSNGLWNSTNHLLRMKRPRLSTEKVAAIRTKIRGWV